MDTANTREDSAISEGPGGLGNVSDTALTGPRFVLTSAAGGFKGRVNEILTRNLPIVERMAELWYTEPRFRNHVIPGKSRFPERYNGFARYFNSKNPQNPIPETFSEFLEALGLEDRDVPTSVRIVRDVVKARIWALRIEKDPETDLEEKVRQESQCRFETKKTLLKTEFRIVRKALQYYVDQCIRQRLPEEEHNRHYEQAFLHAEKLLRLVRTELPVSNGGTDYLFDEEDRNSCLREVEILLTKVFLRTEESDKPSSPVPAVQAEIPVKKETANLETWKKLLDRIFPNLQWGMAMRFWGALVSARILKGGFCKNLKEIVQRVNESLEKEWHPLLATTPQGIAAQFWMSHWYVWQVEFYGKLGIVLDGNSAETPSSFPDTEKVQEIPKNADLAFWKSILDRTIVIENVLETFRSKLIAATQTNSFWFHVSKAVSALNLDLKKEWLPLLANLQANIAKQLWFFGGGLTRESFFEALGIPNPNFFRKKVRSYWSGNTVLKESPVAWSPLSQPPEIAPSRNIPQSTPVFQNVQSRNDGIRSVLANAMRTPLDQRLVRLAEFSKQWNRARPEHSLPETLDDWLVETGAWENCTRELSSVALALGKSPGGGFQSIFARAYTEELATFFSWNTPERSKAFLHSVRLKGVEEGAVKYPLDIETLYRILGQWGAQIFDYVFRLAVPSKGTETPVPADSPKPDRWRVSSNRGNGVRKVFPVAARRRTVKEAPRSIVEYSFFQLLRDRLFPFLARFDAPLRKHVFAIFRKLIDDEAVPEHLQQELLETRVLLREDVVIFLFSKNLTTHLVEFQSYLLEALVPNDENIANVEYSVEVAWITIPMDRSLELFQEDAWNDPFKILGIGRNFSEAEAKKIHRRLMMQHHPDREGEGADENYATELNKAWEAVCKVKGWRTKGT